MFNFRLMAVLKRELRDRLLSKGFIIMTVLMPVFMFGIIGIQAVLFQYEGGEKSNLILVTESPDLTAGYEKIFPNTSGVKEGKIALQYMTMDKSSFDNFLKEKKNDLLSEKVVGIIFVPASAAKDKKIEYYSKTPQNRVITEKLSSPINRGLIEYYFASKNLSQEDLDFARIGVDITGLKVTKDNQIKEEGYGNLVLAYLFTFLLYISLLMMGQMIMQSVIEEKANRIVEIILSSVKPSELLAGKILGSAITGAMQMFIWLTPVVLVISTTIFMLPPEITFSITLGHIGYLLINFFVGLITFLGLFATVGSIFDNPQDAQSGLWPVMLLIIIPFFIAFSLIQNPNSPIGFIASFFPFASVMVMPARMTLVDVPIWQLILSFVINLLTIVAIFPIAGKIYRVGILITGKKPKWSEVVRWMKYKY